MINISKKEIEKQLLDEFYSKRLKSENLAKQNKELAYENTEAYKYVCACKELLHQIGFADAQHKNSNNLRTEYNKNHKALEKELSKVNLTIKNLTPIPECKKCNDMGFINGKMCSCYKKLLSKKLLEYSGLNINTLPKFSNVNFDIFEDDVKDTVKKIYSFAEKYSKTENPEKNIVTFCGEVGVGKTVLTECMVNEYFKQNKFVQFISAFELNQLFLQYHLAELNKKEQILSNVINCDVLIIDDLGVENTIKNVTKEYLYMLITLRQNSNKITIISTNLMPDALEEKYDERIFSRLLNKRTSFLSAFPGTDLRLKKVSK